MEVIHVAASLSAEWGGPTQAICGLADALVANGVNVSIYATATNEEVDRVVLPERAQVRLFDPGKLAHGWTRYSPALARAIRKDVRGVDLAHIHELWHHPHYAAAVAARRSQTPYMVTVHGCLSEWALSQKAHRKRAYWGLIQQRLLKQASTLIAFTAVEQAQIRAMGVQTPIRVIPNGVEPLRPVSAMEDGTEDWLPPGLVILYLGRLHPGKGIHLLVEAFKKLMARQPDSDANLIIAGPDNPQYREWLDGMLSPRHRERVTFTGLLTGVRKQQALRRADLFVLPSYSEGFSMAALEALAAGVPVILTRQCNFPEVGPAGAGRVIETDPDELADVMIELSADAEQRHRMAKNAEGLIQARYSWKHVAREMISAYEAVIRR